MNRSEALRTLGLDANATQQDIEVAYKECVQILHPDKFAGKKKLQERATEQFKNLQEAYEVLTSGKASRSSSSGSSASGEWTYASGLEAQLSGIIAAREQLVAQRDAELDSRSYGLKMLIAGALLAFLTARVRLLPASGLGGALAVWGLLQTISSHNNLSALNDQINDLKKRQRSIEEELEAEQESSEPESADAGEDDADTTEDSE